MELKYKFICVILLSGLLSAQNDTNKIVFTLKNSLSLSLGPEITQNIKEDNSYAQLKKSRTGTVFKIDFNRHYGKRNMLSIGLKEYRLKYRYDYNSSHSETREGYFEIPLMLRHSFQVKSFTLQAVAGFGINYFYFSYFKNTNFALPNSTYEYSIRLPFDRSTLFITYHAACNLAYFFSNGFRIFMEPHFTRIEKVESIANDQQYIMGFNTGIQFALGNNKMIRKKDRLSQDSIPSLWQSALFVNSGISSIWGKPFVPSRNSYPAKTSMSGCYSVEYPAKTVNHLSFYSGFGIHFNVGKIRRSILKTGFEFETYKSSGTVKEFLINGTDCSQSPPKPISKSEEANWKFTIRDTYFSFPFSVVFPVTNRDNILSGIVAGISGNILISESNNGYNYNNFQKRYSVFASIGYVYAGKTRDGISLFIEPAIKSSMNLWSFSVKTGFLFY